MTPSKTVPRLTRAALLSATTMAALCATIATAQTIPPTQDPSPPVAEGAAPVAATPDATAPAATLPDADQTPGTIDAADGADIVVTGYRSSLAKSTNAKRASTGFTDSIFAEDIGKFPDTNIAESFNRIPGITITRDVT
ncbi:MAG: hypothetical protein EOP89_16515, partial [Lysobacteraceae bacterium]